MDKKISFSSLTELSQFIAARPGKDSWNIDYFIPRLSFAEALLLLLQSFPDDSSNLTVDLLTDLVFKRVI